MATSFTFTSTGAASAPTGTARWSVSTLANQLLGEVNQDRNAAGAAPNRLNNLVIEGLRTLWDAADWVWQIAIGTLSVSADDTYEDLAEDVRKLNSKWIRDRSKSESGLVFTTSPSVWEAVNSRYRETDTGEPIIACVLMRTTGTTDRYRAYLAPKAKADRDYRYVYQRKCPIDLSADHADYKSSTGVIIMPGKFHEGWRLRSRYKVLQAFRRNEDSWKDARDEWRAWMREALQENNEMLTSVIDGLTDGYGDLALLMGGHPSPGLQRIRGGMVF